MAHLRFYEERLSCEPSRVVIRPFQIAPEPRDLKAPQHERIVRIVRSVLAMDEAECAHVFADVARHFIDRHWQTRDVFIARYSHIADTLDLASKEISESKKELIGAYFCHEYSYAAAALMNPSIAPHPDQSGLGWGDQRFILTLRAVGEGHISSIAFREGILSASGELALWPPSDRTIAVHCDTPSPSGPVVARRPDSVPLSGAVIFPFTRQQRNGLEDLRLTHFREDDGEMTYHGAYTAYSGADVRSELMTTRDFVTFALHPMTGTAVTNKGMALFPRRIDGAYAMIGRQDGESLWFLQSDNIHHWDGGRLILKPTFPWEIVQIGNCGPPIELDEGWLLLTHGVGAMRRYSLSAILLDKTNPSKVLARLHDPLLAPSDEQRNGYVPNVLYTCGALKHGRMLFIPFGVADSSVSFMLADTASLLQAMR